MRLAHILKDTENVYLRQNLSLSPLSHLSTVKYCDLRRVILYPYVLALSCLRDQASFPTGPALFLTD